MPRLTRARGAGELRAKGDGTSALAIEQLEARLLLSTVSFGSPVTTTIATAGPAASVVVGDLNGDHIPDLVDASSSAAALQGAFTAQIFLGNSTGALTPKSIVASGGQVLALADFTGDGKLDLATGAGVLPGNGDGTFAQIVPGFTLPANTVSLFTGDFNGDGKMDLAAATFSTSGSNPSIGLSVMLGKGDGTFQSPVSTTVATAAGLIQADAVFVSGDFNGDRKLDIASPFGVLLGKGDGTFQSPMAFPSAALPANPVLAVADFNGDKKLDLATVLTNSRPGQLEVLPGNGDGTFKDNGTVTVSSAGAISALAAADLNGDGSPDLIAGISSNGSNPAVVVLPGNGDGTFSSAQSFAVDGAPVALFTGDFNGDKAPDIISVNAAAGTSPGAGAAFGAASAAVLLNGSSGSSSTPAGSNPSGSSGSTPTRATGPVGTTPATVILTPASNPGLVGAPMQLTTTVTGSGATPTGTVNFTDGSLFLGTATLKNGKATLVTTALPVGFQRLTAFYLGDGTYAPGFSNLNLTMLVNLTHTPVLVPDIAWVIFPRAFVAGERGTIGLRIIDGGAAPARGQVGIDLFASPDGRLDASAVPLRAFPSHASVHPTIGRSITIATHFAVGTLAPGTYTILAQLTPLRKFTAGNIYPAAASSPRTFQAAGDAFGNVGGRKILATVTTPDGRSAVLSIVGRGTGSFTQSAGAVDIAVSGTGPASRLQIASRRGFSMRNVTVAGPLASLDSANVTINGNVTIGGTVRFAVIGGISGGTWAVAGGIGTLRVLGNVSAARIFAGANAGPDNVLDTADDSYAAAVIDSIRIDGSDTSSVIAAGAAPPAGGTINTGLTLLPGGRIKSVTVRGAVGQDSRFLAALIPVTALLAGARVAPATDPHFHI